MRSVICRTHSFPLSLVEASISQLENYPNNDESEPQDSQEDILAQTLGNDEVLSM